MVFLFIQKWNFDLPDSSVGVISVEMVCSVTVLSVSDEDVVGPDSVDSAASVGPLSVPSSISVVSSLDPVVVSSVPPDSVVISVPELFCDIFETM